MLVKRALITGGTSKLGLHIADYLSNKGYELILHYNTTPPNDLISSNYQAFSCDFSNVQEAESIIKKILIDAGPIDLLINNSASFIKDLPDDFTAVNLEESLAINSIAPALVTKLLCQRATSEFAVINILDYAIATYPASFFSYNISKRLLADITKVQAAAYAPKARINGLALSPVIQHARQSKEHFNLIANQNLWHQSLSTAEVLNSIGFLIDSKSVTGQILFLDYGKHLYIDPYDS